MQISLMATSIFLRSADTRVNKQKEESGKWKWEPFAVFLRKRIHFIFRKLDYVHGVSNLNLFWAEIIENEYLGDRDIQLFYNREQDVLESLKRVFRVLGDLGVLIKHSSYLFKKKIMLMLQFICGLWWSSKMAT